MKVMLVLEDFLNEFYFQDMALNRKLILKWFDGSKWGLNFSRNIKYQLADLLENNFSKDSDGISFKIDWVKIRKHFIVNQNFLKKIDDLQKKAKQ